MGLNPHPKNLALSIRCLVVFLFGVVLFGGSPRIKNDKSGGTLDIKTPLNPRQKPMCGESLSTINYQLSTDLLPQKIIMETQDLLLMVLLLSPGLLLSVTIMLTFAAGG